MAQNGYHSYSYGSETYYNDNVATSRSYNRGRNNSHGSAKRLEASMQQPMLDGSNTSNPTSRPFESNFNYSEFEAPFSHSNVNYDHNLQTLLDNQRSFAPREGDAGYSNPIINFYNDADGPWSSVRATSQVRASSSTAALTVPGTAGNLDFNSYREAPPSELSDSGYASQAAATQSIISTEPTDYNRDCGDLPLHVSGFQLGVGSDNSPPFDASHCSQQAEDSGSRSRFEHPKLVESQCPHCFAILRCRSDLKKHILKHDKPWKCDYPDCPRTDGFGTINDLNRHKKSVHRLGGMTKSFRCVADRCKAKDKVWPRLDNFKQHVQRLHPDEDLEDMIRRSQCFGALPPPSAALAKPVSPMENTLAGIGAKSSPLELTQQDLPDFGFMKDRKEDGAGTTDLASSLLSNHRETNQRTQGQMLIPRIELQAPTVVHGRLEQDRGIAEISVDATRLRELADAATAASVSIQSSSVSSRAKSGQPASHLKRNSAAEDPQKKILSTFSNAIASRIINGTPNEPLDKAVLRALLDLDKSQNVINPLNAYRKSDPAGNRGSKDIGQMQIFDGPDGTEGTISTAEVLQGLAALSKRIKQSAAKRHYVHAKGRLGKTQGVECKECGKVLPRNCDMNKHIKRHTKPYGCTFPKCRKVFGSKNDWKRHENSQHFQMETWRCEVASDASVPNSPPCARLFFHKNFFQEHLQDEHKLPEEKIQHELKVRRIGRNGQSRFWCGFCKDIIKLEKRAVEAWDERFDHIDQHFKNQCKIRDWWDIEANKTKGEAYANMEKSDFEDEDPHVEYRSQVTSGSDSDERNESAETGNTSPETIVVPGDPRKKRRMDDDGGGGGKRRRRSQKGELLFYCCHCREGPFAWNLYKGCVNCGRPFCGDCERKRHEPSVAEEQIDFDIFAHGRNT